MIKQEDNYSTVSIFWNQLINILNSTNVAVSTPMVFLMDHGISPARAVCGKDYACHTGSRPNGIVWGLPTSRPLLLSPGSLLPFLEDWGFKTQQSRQGTLSMWLFPRHTAPIPRRALKTWQQWWPHTNCFLLGWCVLGTSQSREFQSQLRLIYFKAKPEKGHLWPVLCLTCLTQVTGLTWINSAFKSHSCAEARVHF